MKNTDHNSSKPGLGGKPLLTASQFTREFAGALRATAPHLQVRIEKDLELELTASNGTVGFGFLNNVWRDYLCAPGNKEGLMRDYIRTICDSSKLLDSTPDRTRILPVLKHRQWIPNNQSLLKARPGNRVIEVVYESYTEEVIIAYAEDTPTGILYPAPERLQKLNLSMAELRQLACNNIRKVLPPPKVQLSAGLLWIRAGGLYDASLLLLDDFWNEAGLDVSGEIVAAIPARDCLVVTGSEDAARVEVLKQVAQIVEAEAAYPLTSQLLIRRQGRFMNYGPQGLY